MGQRNDNPDPAWQMPQGGIDPGEEPQAAALRELWEETGVTSDLVTIQAEAPGWFHYDFPPELAAKLWKGGYRGQKQRWYLMRFTGADNQIVIETEHPEFSEWTWLDPSDLVEKIVPFKRDVYAQVLAAFESHL